MGPAHYRRDDIACYISGQGRGKVVWESDIMIVRPNKGLPAGRSRYNCTAPNVKQGGYYWFSYSWFKKRPDGSWYAEQ
jgi:hypothetical protein